MLSTFSRTAISCGSSENVDSKHTLYFIIKMLDSKMLFEKIHTSRASSSGLASKFMLQSVYIAQVECNEEASYARVVAYVAVV